MCIRDRLGAIAFLAFFMLSGFISDFFKVPDRNLVYILGLIAVIALLLPVVRGAMQGMQKFKGLGVNLILDAGARLLYLCLFLAAGLGLRGVLLTSLFAALTAYFAGLFVLRHLFSYREENVQILRKREVFGYALPVFLSMLGFSFLSYLDLFMVKHFFSAEQAGLYAVNSIIGKAFLYFPGAIILALFPKVSESFELNRPTGTILTKGLLLTGAISAVGIGFCAVFPEAVLWLLAGGGRYYEISPVVRIFGIAILPLVLFNVVQSYSLAVQKYKFLIYLYAGIILYAVLLWFFHDSFFQVLGVLFAVNLLILVFSAAELYKRKKEAVK